MKNVSIQKMRFEFGEVREALEKGEELVLTFRNRPLARLLPFALKKSIKNDPALHFGDAATPLDPMTNTDLDQAIYG